MVALCPTHHENLHLALDAAVGEMCFGIESVFDRRQFGREIWGYAEEAGLWLRTRLNQEPQLNWRVGADVGSHGGHRAHNGSVGEAAHLER